MNERHLVLVGLMGAGKTTVGRRCAKRLGRSFVDLDDLIMTHAAMSIEEIWRERGEERFRAMEREVVVDVCASPVPLVIACGGGTVVDADSRRRLRGSRSSGVAAPRRTCRASAMTRAGRCSPAIRRACSRVSRSSEPTRTPRPPTRWSIPRIKASAPSLTWCSRV